MSVYLHEVHRVIGASEDDFEAAYRDPGGWMDMLGRGDDARLLVYAHQAHGTGPSYRVVTVTALTGGAAWERLARRVQDGDLHDLVARIDRLRHDVTAKLLLPLPWSPLGDLDLSSVAAAPSEHDIAMTMEDTVWPHGGMLDDYLSAAAEHYVPLLGRPESLLRLDAAWVTAPGAGRRPEVILWQRVPDPRVLLGLFTREVPPERRAPGTWMHDALALRDRWESRLLRAAPWSPWP